jgi:hypothetical protein
MIAAGGDGSGWTCGLHRRRSFSFDGVDQEDRFVVAESAAGHS